MQTNFVHLSCLKFWTLLLNLNLYNKIILILASFSVSICHVRGFGFMVGLDAHLGQHNVEEYKATAQTDRRNTPAPWRRKRSPWVVGSAVCRQWRCILCLLRHACPTMLDVAQRALPKPPRLLAVRSWDYIAPGNNSFFFGFSSRGHFLWPSWC